MDGVWCHFSAHLSYETHSGGRARRLLVARVHEIPQYHKFQIECTNVCSDTRNNASMPVLLVPDAALNRMEQVATMHVVS